MSVKRTPLTREQFVRLNRAPNWDIREVPPEHWDKIPGVQRLRDTVAIMGSVGITDPQTLNGIHSIAGLDVLTYERNPIEGEPEGNAYHYVIQQINDPRYPYLMHGPFKCETIVSHWFDAEQLDLYWKNELA
jgi:hypothetical protein